MTLTQLDYIVAIDTHRHFATAADHCHVTQPTLSMQIQKLEDELGVLIFDRSKHPVVPTETGQIIVAQAREVLQASRRIPELAKESRDEVGGELRVGIIPTLAPYLLPYFIGAFMARYPSVTIQLQELLTEQIVERLRTGLLDVGIVVTPLRENSMTDIPLFKEPFMVYAAKGNSLLEKETINPSDLTGEGLWLLSEGHCFRDQVINLCGGGFQGNSALRYETGSLETLVKLIDRQDGFTLLPYLATLDLDSERQKRLRTFSGVAPVRDVSLVMHRSFLKRSLINALKREILTHLPAELKD
ncbi:LysR substrate-binding domain-containing protein [uncultured Fibrella sp.]|uniref:hydrogen peroxide-inducible genes activator n=1 Tax=uncultured Fibrella sp. TaxID=1284596 RepID=UPI0035CB0D84